MDKILERINKLNKFYNQILINLNNPCKILKYYNGIVVVLKIIISKFSEK